MKSVRLWFKKDGLAIYISHLDMNRCMTRAVRRAGIPLWYTEGFNPHPYMTFLMPLPLGQSGMREPLDIKIEQDDMSFKQIKESLNSVMPEGIEIVDVCKPVNKPNEIAAAEYKIISTFADVQSAESFAANAMQIINGGELNAEKRSKKGTKTVNLCDFIRSFECKPQGNEVFADAVLASGNSVNLNAELLMNTLFDRFESKPLKNEIIRTKLLLENLTMFE